MKKILNREQMVAFLKEKGCKVIGTTEEFDGCEGGIWMSGESNSSLFNYYAESSQYEFGVKETLCRQAESRGWFFEWNDPGTVMCWPD